MRVEVETLRRRPPGPRVLVYLDQSTISALATDARFGELRDLIRGAVRAGRLVCPESLGHSGETIAAARSWEQITKLADELSMGISFRPDGELAGYEAHAAAATFCGEPPGDMWKEAFTTNPQTDRDVLFAGGFRVNAYFPPDEHRLAEVRYAKDSEADLEAVYEKVRADGVSFERQVELEFEAMLDWRLGPLVDSERFTGQLARAKREVVDEWLRDTIDVGPGSALSRYLTIAQRGALVERLTARYPALRLNGRKFADSNELRSMPALRYPALFRAALATMPGRRPKRGDGYDIEHLTKGLSRCDIVTADAGMTQLASQHGFVSPQCTLLRFNDIAGLTAAVEASTR